MSSSLSAVPSDDGPFQAMKPSPARATSVFEHASYRATEQTMVAESSTAHRKRRSIPTVSISPAKLPDHLNRTFKRVIREATPIYEDSADQDQELELEVDAEVSVPGASTAPAETTAAMTTDNDMSGQFLADDERRERANAKIETSEKEEPSVLFSEQEATRTEPTEAMEGSGVMDDEESTVVDVPEPKPSQNRLSRRQSAAQLERFEVPQQGDDDQQGDTEDYADLPWMREQSDGLEDLDEWMDPRTRHPEWDDYLGSLRDDEARGRAIARQRHIARMKRDKFLMATHDGEEEEEEGATYIRTTREQLADALEAGHDEDEVEYHSGDTEDFEMDHRPVLERAGVKRDIRAFMESIDVLAEGDESRRDYQIVDRLGEGTFSSVYLAYDRRHGKYSNDWWTGEPDRGSRESFDSHKHSVKLALKRVLATSSPQRIENELDILESLRGCRNVSQLITAFRQEDQVIIVMPFHRSDDFRHFYRHMDTDHIRKYMCVLLRALADIHARGIIHRDVKPANFLFDYETGEGVLCDFGLAERYTPPRKPTCQHAPATLSALGGERSSTSDTKIVEQALYDARKKSKLGEGRIGFPQDDKRPAIKTNRAGTRGFRAPEVLLKCPDQTVAIDVWSAGVMLLSMLTIKFPLFNSTDDLEALMEIAAIFGRGAMEKCAMLHNRTIMTNCPTVDQAPSSLTEMILTLNPHIYTPPLSNPTSEEAREHIESIDAAIELCKELLRLDATRRFTAKKALGHKFFASVEGYQPELDHPILSGVDGKCGHLHSVEGGKHQAWFYRDCQELPFGQGIPTARDKLCPEHEHWQQRTLLNPISTSNHFTEPSLDLDQDEGNEDEEGDDDGMDGDGDGDGDDGLVVDRPVFTIKNENIEMPTAPQGRLSRKQQT